MKSRILLTGLVLLLIFWYNNLSFAKKHEHSNEVYTSISDGNWNSKSNWDINKAPDEEIDEGDTVHIYHDITFPKDLEIKGVLIIHNGGSLKSNGSKSIEVKDGGAIYAEGDISCDDFEVEDGGYVSSSACIYISGDYEAEGDVFIETTNLYTGSISIKGSKGNTSKITFKRYIEEDSWHYFSAPMEGIKTNKLTGGAVYSYDESSASWEKHENNENMPLMQGYDVYFKKEPKTLTFKGTPNDSSHCINVTYTQNTGDGYNLIGNPYCSSIDWDASSGWTKTNINDAIYMWDDSLQNVASYVNGVGTNSGSNIIPPTMAFFVKCNNYSGGQVCVTKDVQIDEQENFRSTRNLPMISVKLSGSRYYDESVLRFSKGSTNAFEADLDAEKMFSYNNQVPQIYFKDESGTNLCVHTTDLLAKTNSFNIYSDIKVEGEYSFAFNLKNIDNNVSVLLEDRLLNKLFDLKQGEYKFFSGVCSASDRFIIHVFYPEIISETSSINTDQNELKAWVSNQFLHIEAPNPVQNLQLDIYDLSGKIVKSRLLNNVGSQTIKLPRKLAGICIVKIQYDNQYQIIKAFN